MKHIIAFIFLTVISFTVRAQYAIIKDKDGFVNVREHPNGKSAVLGKIYNGELFSYDSEDNSQWPEVFKDNLMGYVDMNRIFPISKFNHIKSIKLFKDSCVAINDSIKIMVKSVMFNSKKHKLLYHKSEGLVKIDGKSFWGCDGELPKKAIRSVTLIINSVHVIIPKDAFNDLYEPNLESLQVYLGDHNMIYIEMDNSDGAGYYSIIWIIKNSRYLKRYIDNSMA